MAWYNEQSNLQFGKYKGLKVSQVNDSKYIDNIHHSNLNIYFTQDVLDRLKIENKGKYKDQKQ